jgi:protocatechuate 3,4-dioxygenase beta subunit
MYRTQFLILALALFLTGCSGQAQPEQSSTLSSDFDREMPVFYNMPEELFSIDTCPGWNKPGQKILLTGTVYQQNGQIPAPDVILYYYQTNTNGVYACDDSEERNMPKNKLGQTHGYLRGWVKTDSNGRYSIYTTRPGSYPNRNEPAHVHVHVKEPNLKEQYYIDDIVFDNDSLFTVERRSRMENRAGSGIVKLVPQGDIYVGRRDIFLGLNIPDYPLHQARD